MRVIAGEAKGRRLLSVPGEGTRPISDRVKESLFNILADQVADTLFLDLFAGTGSVGIEALSRGAQRAVFVELSRKAIATIKRNLATTSLGERAEVVCQDVFRYLERPQERWFDIVYVAPPQYRGLWARTLRALDKGDLVAAHGLVIAQIHPKEYKPLELTQLYVVDQRRYGSTTLCFFGKR